MRGMKLLIEFSFMLLICSWSHSGLAQCTKCPTDNGCSGQGSGNQCSFPQGNDPLCTYYNPDFCAYPSSSGCPGNKFDGRCCERTTSPIIIDLGGDGFHLSNASRGVWFRPFPEETTQFKVAWPEAGSQNGWLALDRNGNGTIDDFGELFGNETDQPVPAPGAERNGFAALAIYDSRENGGNEDGWISKEDRIYDKLRVWVDENHDGVSQPNELHTLASVGISAIALRFTTLQRTDQNGNVFRYRSAIREVAGVEVGKTIFDVFLQLGAERATLTNRTWPIQPMSIGFKAK